jgi:hypothetical protein
LEIDLLTENTRKVLRLLGVEVPSMADKSQTIFEGMRMAFQVENIAVAILLTKNGKLNPLPKLSLRNQSSCCLRASTA